MNPGQKSFESLHQLPEEVQKRLLDIVNELSAADNEVTAAPWWFIAGSSANSAATSVAEAVTGPFFSRESAEKMLTTCRYRFRRQAVVYCGSGHMSPLWNDFVRCLKRSPRAGSTP